MRVELERDTYGTTPVPLDNAGRDDGKYDYVAIMDISKMHPEQVQGPPGQWHYQDLAAWKAHTTFVRLPADVPVGFDWANPVVEPNSGYDWSYLHVLDPLTLGSSRQERLVGSGTIKSIAQHPDGRYVSIVSSDQGQEIVQENANLTDGGVHVPHLYVLDLGAEFLLDQASLNTTFDEVVVHSRRFHKRVIVEFDDEQGVRFGSTQVNSTLGMPTTDPGAGTGLTLIGGETCAQIGPYYPGELQTDPTARTKLLAVRNTAFTPHPDRLYVGTTGRTQSDNSADPGVIIGAVHVLSLAADGTPSYLDTLTVQQGTNPQSPSFYQVAGLDGIPGSWLQATATPRNVIAVTALNTAATTSAQDRIVLLQDETP